MANPNVQNWLEDLFLDVPDFPYPSTKKPTNIQPRYIVVLQVFPVKYYKQSDFTNPFPTTILDCYLAFLFDGRYFAFSIIFPTSCIIEQQSNILKQNYPCAALVHKCSVRRFQLDAADCKVGIFPPELESKTNTVCLLAIKKMEFLQSLSSTEMSGHDIHDLPNLSTDLDTLELWTHFPLDVGLQRPMSEQIDLSSSSLIATTNRLNVIDPFIDENIYFSAWIVPSPQLKVFRSSLAISHTHGFADPKALTIANDEPQQVIQRIDAYSRESAALIIDSSDFDDIFFSSP